MPAPPKITPATAPLLAAAFETGASAADVARAAGLSATALNKALARGRLASAPRHLASLAAAVDLASARRSAALEALAAGGQHVQAAAAPAPALAIDDGSCQGCGNPLTFRRRAAGAVLCALCDSSNS